MLKKANLQDIKPVVYKPSNRIFRKYYNDNGEFFYFEEHCFGVHMSRIIMTQEDDVRQGLWKIAPNDIVIDAGAHYGSYTLPALAAGATVHAFEVNPWIMKSLKNNCALNHFDKCVFNERVLWDKSDLSIKINEEHLSCLQYGEITEDSHFDCETISIDDYIAPLNLPHLDWIKIDVEGVELKVLQGAMTSIKKYKPNVLLEIHDWTNEQPNKKAIMSFLDSQAGGYLIDGPYQEVYSKGLVSRALLVFKEFMISSQRGDILLKV